MRQHPEPDRQAERYDMVLGQNYPERLRHADGDIISGRNPIMRALDPLGFRFRKTLGQGGGGIAVLVDLLDRNGQADQWVVKASVGGSSLSREGMNMKVGQIKVTELSAHPLRSNIETH
jgi:hypothetical protein